VVSKREVGSKLQKKILKLLLVPNVPEARVKRSIQFGSEDENGDFTLLYNRNHEISFFKYKDRFLPSIRFLRANPVDLPAVRVDQGAVTYVLNGANIFCQGIEAVDRDFDVGTIVMVLNPQNAVLALGEAVKPSQMLVGGEGQGIKNIHYLNDQIWTGK
jgi:predicted RNA-binding protein (TIGR00451 family)